VGGRVVRMEPPVLMEPPAGRVGDVRRPVVEHQVHRKICGDTRVELVKEGDEVRGGVAVQAGGLDHPAAVHVQRSQQGRGAMADVLVLLAGRPAGATGWVGRVRLRAPIPVFSSTDSTSALVGGTRYSPQTSAARSQKAGSSGRVIQPRTRWGLMSRSARIRPIWEAEIPMSVRQFLGQLRMAPVAGRIGRLLGHGGHDPKPLVVAVDQRAARPWAVLQAGQALSLETTPPVANGAGSCRRAWRSGGWGRHRRPAARPWPAWRPAARPWPAWRPAGGVVWARTRRCSSARSCSVITSGGDGRHYSGSSSLETSSHHMPTTNAELH
jgi:hypothetical protein